MKSLKLSEYVRIVNPEYVYLKLKPNNSIRNQNTHLLARTISGMYKRLWEGLKKEEAKLINFMGKEYAAGTKWRFERQGKVSYYIYMEKKKVEFYFILPRQHMSIIKERIGDVWSGLTMEEVETVPQFGESATMRQLLYEKEDGLSLRVDKRDNDLLNSNLNIIDVMEDGDRCGIFYNFIGCSQNSFRHSYNATIQKVKRHAPVDRQKTGLVYAAKMALSLIDTILRDISEVVAGKNVKQGEESVLEGIIERLNGGKQVSEHTQRKGTAAILQTQILLMSESGDRMRQRNNAYSLAQSYDVVSDDNKLVSKPYKGKLNIQARQISGAGINKVSDGEAQNFLSLPGRELLERYDCIEKIETQETEVPEDLQEGVLCIGENIYRGKKQKAYLSNDKEYRFLSAVIIGPNRAGKSNLIGNLSIDALEQGECMVIFDFIKNCELSEEVAKLFPPEKVKQIECGNPKKMEGLGYNEVGVSADPFLQYANAKRQTTQLMTFVNSINSEELSPKMERYLVSASLVVFLCGGSFRDVFNTLQSHRDRYNWMKKVPASQKENMKEYIDDLHELDEYNNKGELSGTKTTLIVGIIDRLNKMKNNPYMEMMLKKDTSGNCDLSMEMQKNQLIVIKMPEHMFSTDSERDIYTTYWITKLWLALQIRGHRIPDRSKLKKVNLVIDELYQVKHTEKFLRDKLSRLPKFGIKPIISCHYLQQINHIREELRSANASYLLISGSDKKNYGELKEELYPYEQEDLLHLPRHHSLNLIKSEEGYGKFITKLPGKVEDRVKRGLNIKTDNLHK